MKTRTEYKQFEHEVSSEEFYALEHMSNSEDDQVDSTVEEEKLNIGIIQGETFPLHRKRKRKVLARFIGSSFVQINDEHHPSMRKAFSDKNKSKPQATMSSEVETLKNVKC